MCLREGIGSAISALEHLLTVLQVALSGDGQFLVVHAPLPYSRMYNTPGNEDSGNVYTYKLVSSFCLLSMPKEKYLHDFWQE